MLDIKNIIGQQSNKESRVIIFTKHGCYCSKINDIKHIDSFNMYFDEVLFFPHSEDAEERYFKNYKLPIDSIKRVL